MTLQGAGKFKIKDLAEVTRLGFGAMRVTGEGTWGEPADIDRAHAVVRKAVGLGVDFIDTADSYGPEVSERILCDVLYHYPPGLDIGTKPRQARQGPGVRVRVG